MHVQPTLMGVLGRSMTGRKVGEKEARDLRKEDQYYLNPFGSPNNQTSLVSFAGDGDGDDKIRDFNVNSRV